MLRSVMKERWGRDLYAAWTVGSGEEIARMALQVVQNVRTTVGSTHWAGRQLFWLQIAENLGRVSVLTEITLQIFLLTRGGF